MRKKSASGVRARHGRLTGSAAFTSVPRVIPRGVNLSGSPYRKSTIRPWDTGRSPTRARPQT
ncbi:MAG: hypothetical protein GDA66_17455 [Nitrospira sp. CR1.2]|nr:hypothetical protein [Nitrospira sp. CR1.2]